MLSGLSLINSKNPVIIIDHPNFCRPLKRWHKILENYDCIQVQEYCAQVQCKKDKSRRTTTTI